MRKDMLAEGGGGGEVHRPETDVEAWEQERENGRAEDRKWSDR